MSRVQYLSCLFFISAFTSFAQPSIQWQNCFGGSQTDGAYSIQQTFDGAYVVAGQTSSADGNVIVNYGYKDFWILKLDTNGSLLWQKSLGGSGAEQAYAVQQTSDSGYIVAGHTNSSDGDVTGYHAYEDCWITKLDKYGNLEWQKCLGGTGDDYAWSIEQTFDGGYIFAGYTTSNDGDVSGNHNTATTDYWIVKLNSIGILQWQKCLGGSGYDNAWSIKQTPDSGFIIGGTSTSTNGDVTGNHGYGDFWIVKVDIGGGLIWQKCFGGSNDDYAFAIQPTLDGGFIAAGRTESLDGDVSGNHDTTGAHFDAWIIKGDSLGVMQWQKCLGGSLNDEALSVQQTSDGGYVLAGYADSNDGDVTNNFGSDDYWIVKLDSLGILDWQKSFGGSSVDDAESICQTADGGYIIAGLSLSNDSNVTGNHGSYDYWVLKLENYPTAIVENYTLTNGINIYPNPANNHIVISLSNNFQKGNITITDVTGKEICNISDVSERKLEVNTKDFATGIYFVQILTPDFVETKKLIIEN